MSNLDDFCFCLNISHGKYRTFGALSGKACFLHTGISEYWHFLYFQRFIAFNLKITLNCLEVSDHVWNILIQHWIPIKCLASKNNFRILVQIWVVTWSQWELGLKWKSYDWTFVESSCLMQLHNRCINYSVYTTSKFAYGQLDAINAKIIMLNRCG